ncbi:MAG: DNA repair protein RecO, partial [Rikenellaceae bacterium]
TYKASGVVLHTIKYGDNSLIAYIYTDLYGRLSYLVRGVSGSGRRTRGNKAALLQPMSVIEFEGYQNRHSQLHSMRDVRNKLVLKSLPFDLSKSAISLFMAEVLYRLVREETPNQPLFDFVSSSVEALDMVDTKDRTSIANFHLWFLVQLSRFLGFYPSGEYSLGDVFDIREGVFCSGLPFHGTYMCEPSAMILNQMMNVEPQGLAEVKLSGEKRNQFVGDLLNFIGFHFDMVHNINSLKILQEVFR